MFPINFPATHTVHVDPYIWKACAGNNVVIPVLGSTVYYFPEGHASDQLDSSPASYPIFRCRVLNVRYLADRASDEVFASILLQQAEYDFRGKGLRIDSYMKTLTQSDANNGGGFSVPRHCAESIFPGLNYREDPPVQNLTITDVQGVDWMFRHIFRGTPKRHLLTTGWSKFVNYKKLIAGDQVIFMRDNFTGKLYAGIRRLEKSGGTQLGSHLGEWELDDEIEEEFWRSGNKGMYGRFVKEATMHAAQGKPFEIIVDPRNGLPDVLINADGVDRAMSFRWVVGMSVKMVVETQDDSLRSICRRGHISMVVNSQVNGQWRCSPWKMLQVTWVEPEHLQNVERLSPWQVEYAEPASPIQPVQPGAEIREPHYFQPLVGRDIEPHPMIGHGDPRSELLNLTLFNSNTPLTSMQGARQSSDVSTLIGGNTHQIHSEGNFSLESLSSLRSFGTDVGNLPTTRGCISSIQLFGKLIYVNNPSECQSGDASCLETDCSSKGDTETYGSKVLPGKKLNSPTGILCQDKNMLCSLYIIKLMLTVFVSRMLYVCPKFMLYG